MNKKKVVTLDEGEDPLSTGSNAFAKKPAAKNVFERVIQEQEKDLLHGPNDKKTGFVVNKNTQVHISSKDVSSGQGNTASTNPFNKQPARLPQQPMQPREVVFPNQPKREGERKKTPSPPHRPFENPKVKELARAPEERHQVSPPKPSSGHPAPQREAVRLINVDLVPGEKPIASVTCSIYLLQYPHLSTEGTLVMTNYQIIFRPSDESFYNRKPKLKKDYLQMPLTFINKLEKTGDKRAGDLVQLDIHSKDGRSFRIRISEKYASDIMQYLNVYAFPERKDHFFAIEYGKANRELEDRFKGWKIYDIEKEFLRQGCDFEPTGQQAKSGSNRMFRILENKDFRICSTYPPKLLIPAKISDSAFFASSRFRTKERVPCVTYYYAKTKAILARSSQSKPGLYQSRCLEDEQLLRYLGNPDLNDIGDTGVTDVNLYIYDARPYLNAMANRVNGKGFEDTKWYRNCEIFFMDIDNIHHVRDGHRKMLNLCYNPDTSNIKWYSQLESSNWLEFISFIMGASIKITSSLRNGKNCLVHCSDGWDRTAQILSLAQIMLDPYFRTIEGFEVLIMKDWVYFGHQFNMRMGHGNRNEKDDQRSPVFLQFLDCIHQLICQYPFAFEFNQKFLADLAYHAYSCKFGLFLCNSFKEIMEHKLEERTISVWSYMNAQKDKYYNLYYNGPGDSNNPLILKPSHHLKHLKIWEEYFLSYSWLSKPNYELSESIQFSTDFYEYILKKDRKKIRELKAEVEDLRAKLKHYQAKEKSERKDSESPEADALEEEKIDMTPSQKKIKKKKEVPELTHSETIKTTIEDDEGERSPKDLADLEVENRISEISEPEKMKSENLLETGGGESGEGSEAIKSEVDENKISEEKEVKKEESEVEAANKESEKREENGKVEEKGEVGAKTSEEKEVKKEETEVTDKEGTEEKGKVDEKATESADLKKEEIQIENKEEKREEKAEINDTKNIKGQDVKNEEKPVEIQKEEEKKESLNKHEEEGSKKVEESEVETVEKAEEKALDEAEKKETLAVESAAEKNELIQNEEKGESAFEQNLEQKDEKEKEVIVTQNEERTETNII